MPPATVRWLDERAGRRHRCCDGRIAIGGDLDDWPFRNQGGSFDARARIRDATLKFNKRVAGGRALDLDLAFDGAGLHAAGSGDLLGNHVSR